MAIDVAKLAIQLEAQGAEAVIEQLEGLGGAARGLASAVATSVVAFEALEKSMEFLKESVAAATEEDQGIARVGIAVKNAGVDFEKAKPQIMALFEALADRSTFRVDEIAEGFARLVQITGDVGGSMKALGSVVNLAAARHIDLDTAATAVGKAMEGNFQGLRRMGIIAHSTEEAMRLLNERYAGTAEALADKDPQELAAKAMHELEEEIGHVIKEEGGLDEATRSWRDVLKDATTFVHEHRQAIGNLVASFLNFVEGAGRQVLSVLKGMYQTWQVLNIAVAIGVATIRDIGPVFDLVAAKIINAEVAILRTAASIIPGLQSALGGVIDKMHAYATTLEGDAHVALAKNKQDLEAAVEAVKGHKDAVEADTYKIKDHTNAHADTTKELYKEIEALTKLAELHKLSGPEFVKLQADYAKLTALVAKHTLSLEDEAKAEELLAKMRKANPLLGGPTTIVEPFSNAKMKQTIEQGMAIYEKEIVDGLKKTEAADKAALKHKAEMFAASSQGQFYLASEKIKETLREKVKSDFLNLSVDLAGTIADTLSAAFTGGFKAAGKAALAGLGNILASMGKQMIVSGLALVGLLPALSNPFTSGAAMIAAGVILSAAGALLGGIATGSGGGAGGGAGSSIAGAGTASKAAQVTNITLQSAGSSKTGKLSPMAPVNVTVIGPNDGKAQRELVQLLNNAHARGLAIG